MVPFLLAIGGALLAACADGSSSNPAPEAEAGQPMLASLGAASFQQYCASCHGTDARGNGPAAAALRTRPADLTRIAARRGPEVPSIAGVSQRAVLGLQTPHDQTQASNKNHGSPGRRAVANLSKDLLFAVG